MSWDLITITLKKIDLVFEQFNVHSKTEQKVQGSDGPLALPILTPSSTVNTPHQMVLLLQSMNPHWYIIITRSP